MIDIPKLVAQHDQLVSEIQQLVADLESAHRVAQDPGDTERERKAAAGALAAVVGYLKAIGVKRHLFEPLIEVRGALADAECGLSNPLTRPAEFQKGTSTALRKSTLDRVRAAAMVTLLARAGDKRPTAYDEAARVSGIPRQVLLEFRKNLIAPNPRAPEFAVRAYKRLLADAAQSGIPLRAQAVALSELIESQRGLKA